MGIGRLIAIVCALVAGSASAEIGPHSPQAVSMQHAATRFGFCIGDCNLNGDVTIDELVLGVNIAFGFRVLHECSIFDADGDGSVTVEELVRAVGYAIDGCP